jgi:hypothetical protein
MDEGKIECEVFGLRAGSKMPLFPSDTPL